MDAIVSWVAFHAVIKSHYPKAGNDRPPIGLECMLCIYFLQHWFNLVGLSCAEAAQALATLSRALALGEKPCLTLPAW
jgi:IS5 family transposase